MPNVKYSTVLVKEILQRKANCRLHTVECHHLRRILWVPTKVLVPEESTGIYRPATLTFLQKYSTYFFIFCEDDDLFFVYDLLKVHLHKIFLFSFLHLSNTYRLNNKAFEFFNFVLEFADLFKFFNIRRWLCWRGVSFLVNCVSAEWDSTSTESNFVNVGVFCVDSVDVESHSALTQLTWCHTSCWLCMTPCRLSVREMNQAKTGIHNQLWHH